MNTPEQRILELVGEIRALVWSKYGVDGSVLHDGLIDILNANTAEDVPTNAELQDMYDNMDTAEDEVAYCPNCGTGAILQREPDNQIALRKIEEFCEERDIASDEYIHVPRIKHWLQKQEDK